MMNFNIGDKIITNFYTQPFSNSYETKEGVIVNIINDHRVMVNFNNERKDVSYSTALIKRVYPNYIMFTKELK